MITNYNNEILLHNKQPLKSLISEVLVPRTEEISKHLEKI